MINPDEVKNVLSKSSVQQVSIGDRHITLVLREQKIKGQFTPDDRVYKAVWSWNDTEQKLVPISLEEGKILFAQERFVFPSDQPPISRN